MSQVLAETSRVRRAPGKPRVVAVRNSTSVDLVRMPARRSTRAQGKPAPNYNESALDLADRVVSRKGRQPFLGEVRGKCAAARCSSAIKLTTCLILALICYSNLS